jgi:DNA-binding NarL/FixJ family response regulator
MPITVVIADDMAMMRRAIRRLLDDEPGIKVLGEADDFGAAVKMIEEIKPQIVIMDMHMPDEARLTPSEMKTALASSGTRLLAISIWDDENTKSAAENFGAVILLDKAKLGIDLVAAIRSAVAPG